MRKLNQSGSLLIPFIIVLVLMLGSAGFGAWAFMGRQDYKNNSDAKSAAAVKKAVEAASIKKEAEFAEASKSPYKSYKGPATFGSISFQYPKTWSAFITEVATNSNPINGYFNPDYVPDISQAGAAMALRVLVVNSNYSQLLKNFDSQVKQGTITAAPFKAEKVPSTLGSMLTGIIDNSKPTTTITMVMLPVRDKTIQIWTEGPDHVNDFNKIIMPSFSFEP